MGLELYVYRIRSLSVNLNKYKCENYERHDAETAERYRVF